MFTKKYHIASSEVDPFLKLKLQSLFLIMQDVATEHAELLGIGKSNTIDKNMYWVISRYSVSILREPRYLENIIINTWPGDDLKFLFPRYFEILSEDGEVLVKASSTWCVVDRATHHVSLNPFPGYVSPKEHHEGEEPLPIKIIGDTNIVVEERKVRYTDTDLNGHLNNTKYIEYMVDMHGHEFYKENYISHITINYDSEILSGETITLSSNEKMPEIISGKVGNRSSFTACIDYKKR